MRQLLLEWASNMARKKLGISTGAAEPPKREPETIKAEIADLERIAGKRRGKPGYAANVAEIEARLEACRAELDDANG